MDFDVFSTVFGVSSRQLLGVLKEKLISSPAGCSNAVPSQGSLDASFAAPASKLGGINGMDNKQNEHNIDSQTETIMDLAFSRPPRFFIKVAELGEIEAGSRIKLTFQLVNNFPYYLTAKELKNMSIKFAFNEPRKSNSQIRGETNYYQIDKKIEIVGKPEFKSDGSIQVTIKADKLTKGGYRALIIDIGKERFIEDEALHVCVPSCGGCFPSVPNKYWPGHLNGL
jgi:hypothetical protein